MAVKNSAIPTIDVLPPMSRKARDILYGTLAWAAGVLSIATAVIALVPEWHVERPLTIANTVVLGLWTLGGFKAKKNVPPPVVGRVEGVEGVEGRHEAGESTLQIAVLVLVIVLIVYLVLAIA